MAFYVPNMRQKIYLKITDQWPDFILFSVDIIKHNSNGIFFCKFKKDCVIVSIALLHQQNGRKPVNLHQFSSPKKNYILKFTMMTDKRSQIALWNRVYSTIFWFFFLNFLNHRSYLIHQKNSIAVEWGNGGGGVEPKIVFLDKFLRNDFRLCSEIVTFQILIFTIYRYLSTGNSERIGTNSALSSIHDR